MFALSQPHYKSYKKMSPSSWKKKRDRSFYHSKPNTYLITKQKLGDVYFFDSFNWDKSIIISFTYNKKTIYKYVARKKKPINLKWNDISLLFSVHFKIETNVIIMKIKFELRAFISHKLKMIKRELTFSIIWGENMTDYWSPSTTLAKYYELMFAFINDIKCSYNIFHLCTGFNRSKGVTHVLSN